MFFKLCTRNLHHTRNKMTSDRVVAKETYLVSSLSLSKTRSPSPANCNHLIFLSRRFHRPIYFQFEFISNSGPHRNISDQLQTQALTNVDMSTCSRETVLYSFILTEAYSCRLDLAYFAGKISKNRLVCEMPLHWLIMGSCSCKP